MESKERRSLPFKGENSPGWGFRSFLLALITPLYRILFRTRYIDFHKIPEGPCIISGNHTSYIDPVALYLNKDKIDIHFVAQEGIYKSKVLGWILDQMGAIKVNRGTADRVMIRNATKILEQGEKLGIFPEGTRGRSREDLNDITQAHAGAAFIATRADVPIVPVGLSGFENISQKGKLIRFPKTICVVGDPIYPADVPGERKEKIENMTALVMEEIVRLREVGAEMLKQEKLESSGYLGGK